MTFEGVHERQGEKAKRKRSDVVTSCDEGSNSSMTYIVIPFIVIKSTPLVHNSLPTEIPSLCLLQAL